MERKISFVSWRAPIKRHITAAFPAAIASALVRADGGVWRRGAFHSYQGVPARARSGGRTVLFITGLIWPIGLGFAVFG
ncbi:MAG: hypothetical protein ACI91F_003234 [Candidatus Binatia bacterium]|jgi:hypothetical protein